MRANAATLIICLLVVCFGCTEQPPTSEKIEPLVSGSKGTSVESLIEQLVSPVPAKYPTGEWLRSDGPEDINGYINPQVEKARQQLVAMGTKIYPTLAEHVGDDRYSYSGVYAAWVNHSVGTMIADIMAEGIEPHLSGYKSRRNAGGSNGQPSFVVMIRETGGFERYASHAKARSKADLQKEYVQWHISKERSYGFTDVEQEKKVLGEYLKLLEGK